MANKPRKPAGKRPSRTPGPTFVLVAIFLSAASVFLASLIPLRSAYLLMEVRTKSVSFAVKSSEPLPAMSAEAIKIKGICAADETRPEAISVESKFPPSIKGMKARAGQRITLTVSDDVLKVGFSELPQDKRGAPCAQSSIATITGPFQSKDRFGQSVPVSTGTTAPLGADAEFLLSGKPSLASWGRIPVEGDIAFDLDPQEGSDLGQELHVSAIREGRYVFPNFQAESVNLFRGQEITVSMSHGVINAIELDGDDLVVSLSGTAKELETFAGGSGRSLLPSWLDLLSKSVLTAIIAVVLGLLTFYAEMRAIFARKADDDT